MLTVHTYSLMGVNQCPLIRIQVDLLHGVDGRGGLIQDAYALFMLLFVQPFPNYHLPLSQDTG